MSLLMAIGRLMGMEVNLEMMLGTMLGLSPGPLTWIVGFIMHLVISGLIAMLYALGFERVTHRADWKTGVLFSLVHILIGGIFMGLVPAMHPHIPETLPAPGYFLANHGTLGVVAFFILHMIFGAVVGAVYARTGVRQVSTPPGQHGRA